MRVVNVRLAAVLRAHLVCQIPALSFAAMALAHRFSAALTAGAGGGLFNWAVQPPEPKIDSILTYVLLAAFWAVAGIAFVALPCLTERPVEVGSKRVAAFVLYELITIAVLFSGPSDGSLLLLLCYALLLPAWVYSQFSGGMERSISFFIACALLAISLSLLFRTAWSPVRILPSEYEGLPSYTRLADGRTVENSSFLVEHGMLGSPAVDVCHPPAEDPVIRAVCLSVPRSVFKSSRQAFQFFPLTNGIVYRWDTQTLVAYEPVKPEQRAIIESLWGFGRNASELQDFVQRSREIRGYDIEPQSAEADDFLARAGFQIGYENNLGRFFYHHAYMYVPLLEEFAHSGLHQAPSQYGQGLTRTFAALWRSLGPPSFGNYFRLYWLFIEAYVLLAALPGWLLGNGRWGAITAMIVITLALVRTTDIEALDLAPGFSPMRHLPDLLCLAIVFADCRWRRWWTAALRAGSLGLFLWWNREFGLFFAGASLAWHGITLILAHGQRGRAIAQLGLEAVVVVVVLEALSAVPDNGLTYYNLMGLPTPPARWLFVLAALGAWTPAILWLMARLFDPDRDIAPATAARQATGAIGLLYCALASIYPIWNSAEPDLLVIAVCAVVPIIGAMGGLGKYDRHMVVVGSFALIIATIFAAQDFDGRQQGLKRLTTFSWDFPGLKATVTADPQPLKDGLALIQRYQPEGPLVLVSQYDAVLYMAARRTPALPFIDLKSAIVSWAMFDKIAAALRASNAPYIFVDRDMFADRGAEILRAPQILGPDRKKVRPDGASELRADSLATLGELFREVSGCYKPLEAAGVLRVWQNVCLAKRP
jgi:hypothetical protein